jgi:hypothetical protein
MTDKRARKFEKLLEACKDARRMRKRAAAARREIKGLGGWNGAVTALASPAGARAVEAELNAMKAERRALKKLYAFAQKHASSKAGSMNPGTNGRGDRKDERSRAPGSEKATRRTGPAERVKSG